MDVLRSREQQLRVMTSGGRWLLSNFRRFVIDVVFIVLAAVALYWIATTAGWIAPGASVDADEYRAVQRYSTDGAEVQWRKVDLHGLGSESIVVLVRPKLPLEERELGPDHVQPYLVVLEQRSPSFFDRIAQREPGYFEAYRLTMLDPPVSIFGWDASLGIVSIDPAEPDVVVVEWTNPIADDVLRAVTVTSWQGEYATAFLPNPYSALDIDEPFPHLGHPAFESNGEVTNGWYLNRFTAYRFLELDGDPSLELGVVRALEFVPGFTYETECRACPHRYIIAVYDVGLADRLGARPAREWNLRMPGESRHAREQPGTYVSEVLDLDTSLDEFLIGELKRLSPPWWPSE